MVIEFITNPPPLLQEIGELTTWILILVKIVVRIVTQKKKKKKIIGIK
jgi:hypothetical protein